MAEVSVVETPKLDILDLGTPALSSTNDMLVVETKPDVVVPKAEPDLFPEPEVEVLETDEGKTEVESATAPESKSASDEPKKAKGVQKRLDELVKQREEANERAKAADERLEQALRALEAAGKREEKVVPPDPEPQRPTRSAYPDQDQWEQEMLDYADKKAAWTAKREVKAARDEQERQTETKEIEESQRLTREAYAGRLVKIKEKYADFSEVAETETKISMPMAHVIIHSENGPELQYYLAKNPAEIERITKLTPPLQLMELGKIEAKLIVPEAPAPKPISVAPKPIKPITAGSESMPKSPENESMDEYAARRKSEMRAQVRH